MTNSSRRVRIGIDTGGTFTDVVAVDDETGTLATVREPDELRAEVDWLEVDR